MCSWFITYITNLLIPLESVFDFLSSLGDLHSLVVLVTFPFPLPQYSKRYPESLEFDFWQQPHHLQALNPLEPFVLCDLHITPPPAARSSADSQIFRSKNFLAVDHIYFNTIAVHIFFLWFAALNRLIGSFYLGLHRTESLQQILLLSLS